MLPQRQAAVLGERLKTLTADDSMPLRQMLWQLRGEVLRDPGDLTSSTALILALSLAGLADEARAETARASQLLLSQMPTYPILHTNVVHALINAGNGEAAKNCLQLLCLDDGDSIEDRWRHNLALVKIGVIFGDADYVARSAQQKWWRLISDAGLMPFWAAQQAAVIEVLGSHVASVDYELASLDGGPDEDRLVLTYNTDICSWSELFAIEGDVWTELERVYAEHPDGVGAMLGSVIIGVRGPKIPLEDLLP